MKKDLTDSLTGKTILLAAIIVIIGGLIASKSILIPILLAVFISIICIHPISILEKKKVPYALAVTLVLSFFIGLMVLLSGIIGSSFSKFAKEAPVYQEKLEKIYSDVLTQFESLGVDIDQPMEIVDPGKVMKFTSSALSELGDILSDSFVILLIVVFMLLEAKILQKKITFIGDHFGHSLEYLNKISNGIRHYLSIKTYISLITGILIWLWLTLISVDYAVLWGVIAFLLNYIPNIGSLIAAVPAVLFALTQQGLSGMLWTALGFLIVNTIMGSVIEPKVMGKGLGLSTLVVFLSLIVWGFIFGPAGMFLSVPLTITVKIILEQNENTIWMSILLGDKPSSIDKSKEELK